MAAEYQHYRKRDGTLADGIKRMRDNAFIPNRPSSDWKEYQQWLAAGNQPDQVPPPPRPQPDLLETVQVADPEHDADAVNLRTLDARLEELTHRIDELETTARRA